MVKEALLETLFRPETLNVWTYSLHACNKVVRNLELMRTQDQHKSLTQTHHKEEMNARIKSDAKDRTILRQKLEVQSARANREGLVPGPPAVGPTRGYSREIFYGAPLPTYTSSNVYF